MKLMALSILGALASFSYQNLRTNKDTYDTFTLQQKYGPWSVVLGASEGLGAAWAELFCSQGLNVVTIARRQASLEERKLFLEGKYSCKVEAVVMDLLDSEHVTDALTKEVLKDREVGLFVYNAAFAPIGPFSHSLGDQTSAVKVNVESATRAAYAFIESIQEHNRSSSGLILMSSTLGETGSGYAATYSASKAYTTILAHGLAAEFKHINMDVLACVAGPIDTPNLYRSKNNTDDIAFMIQDPSEVASECLYALGQGKYSIATGPIQKVYRFLANRILPKRLIVDSWSEIMMNQDASSHS